MHVLTNNNQLYQPNNQQWNNFTNQTTKNEQTLPTKQPTMNQLYQPNNQQWTSFTNQSTHNEPASCSSHWVQFNLSDVDWTATGILHYKHAFSSRCWVRAQWDHIPDRSHGNNPEVLPWEGKKWDWEAVIKQGVVRFVFQPQCTSFHPRPCNHFAPPGKENFLAGSESKWTDARKTETSVAEKEKWCKNGGLSAVISEARGLPKFFIALEWLAGTKMFSIN